MRALTTTRGVTRWCGQVLAWLVIVVVLGVLAICVLVPRAGGGTPYTVLTSSMEPDFPPGTLVVVRPAAPEDVAVGDVITFQLVSGRPEVATHRVIAITASPEGTPEFVTQGDANPNPDDEVVVPAQLKGELWYAVPELGRVNLLVDNAQRHVLTVLVASGLFAYAGVMVIGSLLDRRRKALARTVAARAATCARPVEVDA
ncbi:MAG: signal peptidase I [Nocardioides sp.]